jgi:signal transduction histidine kinase
MVQPIQELLAATRRFAQRNFTPIRLERSDELGQLSRSFTDMGNELQHYIRRQRQFVANVSHELRTPLTAIKGYSEYLIDEVKGRPDLEKAVYHLNNESARLHRLVNELLLLSRIDAGREDFQFNSVDLSRTVQQTLDKLRARASKYGVSMQEQIQPAIMVSGDGEKLVQAIINLVDNGIKFSPSGGNVEVELTTTNGMARLTVADQGVGVPTEDLDKVFDRFYRATNAKVVGGTGLGLAITKEIITAHGGDIQLYNRPGGGTKVIVFLPQA